jgi:glycosyltransferase involved in cell wall biosynthesis
MDAKDLDTCDRVSELMEHQENGTPDVSIVVPAYNERRIIDTLEAIGRSVVEVKYSIGVEVIGVDNASTDDTAERIERCGVQLVNEPTKGSASARNAGHQASKGKVILYIDADSQPQVPKHWIDAHWRHYQDPENAVVGVSGTYQFTEQSWLFQCYSQLTSCWRRAMNGLDRMRKIDQKRLWYIGANCSYNKMVAERFGVFDIRTQKKVDQLLGDNLKKHGTVVFDTSPENVVSTSGRRVSTFAKSIREIRDSLMNSARSTIEGEIPLGQKRPDIRD